MTDSALQQGDPMAAAILDFISQHESGGNYNAYFAHRTSTAALDALTLDEVIALQTSRLIAGAASSAIGRYQFLRATLRSLKDQLELTGAEYFTPALQDRLGLKLLEARGLDAFKAGRISAAAFADNLAKEWASLPDIETGRSHYAGDGLNASLVVPTAVLAMLARAISLQTQEA